MVTLVRRLRVEVAPLLALGAALTIGTALDALVLHVDALGAALRLLTTTTP
jgi:hypothetical protein